MINAYFDVSSDAKRQSYYALGALLAPTNSDPLNRVSGWDQLALLWMDATHDLTQPFRSTDCETQNGQFKNWEKSRCDALMSKLVGLLVKANVMAFAVVVPVQEFRQEFPDSGEYDPYFLAVQYALAAIANYGHKASQSVDAIFEDSAATSSGVKNIFNSMQRLSGWPGSSMLYRVSFGDKRMLALQAADLLAREAYKHFQNLEVPTRPTRKPLKRLLGKCAIRCVTPAAITRLRADLNWPSEIIGMAKEASF